MKKLALPLLALSMMFAAPAFADEVKTAPPIQGVDAIPLGEGHERLCNEAKQLQENRIRDLRAAIGFDKETESKLLEGARVRDADAAVKERHAKEWREHAGRNSQKANAFNAFATWLESEAATDRRFANERRNAAGIIGKGWREAENAIRGHEKFLADLRSNC
jgi:hypothetical protein